MALQTDNSEERQGHHNLYAEPIMSIFGNIIYNSLFVYPFIMNNKHRNTSVEYQEREYDNCLS